MSCLENISLAIILPWICQKRTRPNKNITLSFIISDLIARIFKFMSHMVSTMGYIHPIIWMNLTIGYNSSVYSLYQGIIIVCIHNSTREVKGLVVARNERICIQKQTADENETRLSSSTTNHTPVQPRAKQQTNSPGYTVYSWIEMNNHTPHAKEIKLCNLHSNSCFKNLQHTRITVQPHYYSGDLNTKRKQRTHSTTHTNNSRRTCEEIIKCEAVQKSEQLPE